MKTPSPDGGRADSAIYEGSTILITGGTGSVGRELARALLQKSPREIRILSNDENGLFEARAAFRRYDNVRYKLGDVRDDFSIESSVSGCDFVFHAASLKHVDFCEWNPYEAIRTNILGTQNVIDYARKNRVGKFVYVSSDKAVNPVSVMGATKLLGEKLRMSASKVADRTQFCVTRFGNVLGSRGSVLVIFEKQVKEGQPMTITNPSMTRFIMLPSQATNLVLKATELGRSGEIFVLKMKAVTIRDLAEACREFFAARYAKNKSKITMTQIGSMPGEKIHEELMTPAEAARAIQTTDFYIINPSRRRRAPPLHKPASTGNYTSNTTTFLSKRQILSLLEHLYS